MDKAEVLSKIREIGIIPVIRAENSAQALFAVAALHTGGIPIAEITMTVSDAIYGIRECCRDYGSKVLTGAGTVLNVEVARQCIDAGAQFLVTPGLDAETLRFAQQREVLVIPGTLTPSEIMAALNHGAEIVKVFPCGNVGGPAYLKALQGPFPDIRMIPTGGVNLSNAGDYMKAGAFALGVGSDLVEPAALKNSNAQRITDSARQFLEAVNSARPSKAKVATDLHE
ncbi:MAG: bifunctional 4-hydroxy-2-oxoglutarate aldolase/2-dehydro-3-deoxy-phosphogluconate aldolase [Acidobacteriales bacterium]|nr:bifunctional 4-hydroxy-2-oxoglutarate aldolase/2-dehydro-3-deoxy-phosphogluconate aldolase [Terriglobales bacterium]